MFVASAKIFLLKAKLEVAYVKMLVVVLCRNENLLKKF